VHHSLTLGVPLVRVHHPSRWAGPPIGRLGQSAGSASQPVPPASLRPSAGWRPPGGWARWRAGRRGRLPSRLGAGPSSAGIRLKPAGSRPWACTGGAGTDVIAWFSRQTAAQAADLAVPRRTDARPRLRPGNGRDCHQRLSTSTAPSTPT